MGNGEQCFLLLLNGSSLTGCKGETTVRVVFLTGVVALGVLLLSVILLFVSLCCTVCKIKQMKRILKSLSETQNQSSKEAGPGMIATPANEVSAASPTKPSIRLSMDRPPLNFPRQNSRSSVGIKTLDTVDTVQPQLEAYASVTREESLPSTSQAVELLSYSTINPISVDSDNVYSQVSNQMLPRKNSKRRKIEKKGSASHMATTSSGEDAVRMAASPKYYSEVLALERGSYAEQDMAAFQVIDL